MEKKKTPSKRKAQAPKAVKKAAPKAKARAETAKKELNAVVRKARAAVEAAMGKDAAKKTQVVGLKKQYLKSKPVCKITFRLPREAAPDARSVSLVGDFNGWVAGATPMKRLRDGSFSATVELQNGRDYRFRYLIDGGRWENDWRADRYEPNSFGSEDSVVVC